VNNCEGASLYDLMETVEKMVLLVVEEQSNHYIIRKISDGECKNMLAW
jgi:hypothetical protein